MKESRESTVGDILLDDQVISDYLQRNPDFFIRNTQQVEQMVVGHSVRGSVSLVEWYMARQRERIIQLEEEITLLLEQATTNQQLFDQLVMLQAHLVEADNLPDMLYRLQQWAYERGLIGATVRLFQEQWQIDSGIHLPTLPLAFSAFEPIRIQRLGEQSHYLGRLNETEQALLLPHLRGVESVAMSLMGERGELGLLIFSSHNSQHYQAGMGTLLLQYLAQIMPTILAGWIERR